MRKIHFLLTLVALFFAMTNLWAVPTGALPGTFTINSSCDMVYFSQGNLQYKSSKWHFAATQYEYFTSTTDLFTWRSDWNVAVDNGGNATGIWRCLTSDEWNYIIKTRQNSTVNGTANARFARAQINTGSTTVRGLILFPDAYSGGTPEGVTWSGINTGGGNTTCTKEGWEALEAAGCVFLPATGYIAANGSSTSFVGTGAFYQSSTLVSGDNTRFSSMSFFDSNVYISPAGVNQRHPVRLVSNVPTVEKKASVSSAPTAISNLTYIDNETAQALVNAGTASGGTMMYKLSTDANYSASIPTAINAGNYTVQYMVEGIGCFNDFTPNPNTINVTIKRKSAGVTAPSPMKDVEAASLTYNGSAQELLSVTGNLEANCTMMYSIDGENWSEDIPTGENAGDYTVFYKVYKGINEEYIPSPNTIDVTISPADIVLPSISTDLIYTGSPQPLLDVTGIVGGTIYYSVDGNEPWLDVCPSETEIGTYDIWYKVVPDNSNYNAIPATQVTVTIDDPYPFVADNADPSATLTSLLNTPSDLKVKRTIYADGEYNTICLPFSLDASALAASPLAGFNRLKAFRGANVSGSGHDLSIDILVEDVDHIEAGIPYLITYPSAHADIVNPVFTGITVTTTEPSAVSVDGITFQGMFAQVHIDPYDAGHTQDYLFVGANSQLYWPSSDQTSSSIKMRGFRAYFIIDRNSISPALAPKGTRARIMDAPKTTTAIDNTSAKFGGSEKIIENGILYIIRNGVRYNAQGQIVK